jgi:hypothetical protein
LAGRHLSTPEYNRSGESAAVEEGEFGDIAPIHDRRAELLMARIDFSRKLVPGTSLGNDILADREKGFQDGVVELDDFDGAFVAQPMQPQRVIGVELRQGARVFGSSKGSALFDHLVGDGEQARWYVEAEGRCSPEIDSELKPGRLLYWQLGRPCTSEHPIYVHRDLSVKISRL